MEVKGMNGEFEETNSINNLLKKSELSRKHIAETNTIDYKTLSQRLLENRKEYSKNKFNLISPDILEQNPETSRNCDWEITEGFNNLDPKSARNSDHKKLDSTRFNSDRQVKYLKMGVARERKLFRSDIVDKTLIVKQTGVKYYDNFQRSVAKKQFGGHYNFTEGDYTDAMMKIYPKTYQKPVTPPRKYSDKSVKKQTTKNYLYNSVHENRNTASELLPFVTSNGVALDDDPVEDDGGNKLDSKYHESMVVGKQAGRRTKEIFNKQSSINVFRSFGSFQEKKTMFSRKY